MKESIEKTEVIIIENVTRDERWISVKDKLPKDGDAVIFGANNISDLKAKRRYRRFQL